MKKIIILSFLLALLGGSFILFLNKSKITKNNDVKVERYLPLGDSYTIGHNVATEDNFPSLLTKHLQAEGVNIFLIDNPAQTGWTTQDLIDFELPIFSSSKPTFSTLLIGVNDWVQNVNADTFRKRFAYILDEMLKILPKEKIIVITIPDFSATPAGKEYGQGRDISKGIADFNIIIKEESKKRNIHVVDIYPISQEMKYDKSLVTFDGLHPSKKEYERWEYLIFPIAYTLLQQ